MYEYRAIVRDVHDGDTITVDVDLGWKIWLYGERLRLIGINAPELNTEAGKAAQQWLSGVLQHGDEVVVRTEHDKTEKYGRMLAWVWDGDLINDLIVTAGHAVHWDGRGVRP